MPDQTATTLDIVRKMEDAVNRHDIDAFMSLCADNVVWETTTPPDGDRYEGAIAVRAGGEALLRESPNAKFETENLTAHGESAVMRWRYSWSAPDGSSGHVRGVDLITVQDDKIAEILSYVKG
jgi:ketosteroid isomerase-like protein